MKKRFYCDRCKRYLAWPLHICPWNPAWHREREDKKAMYESLSGQLTQANMRLIGVQQKLDRIMRIKEGTLERLVEVYDCLEMNLEMQKAQNDMNGIFSRKLDRIVKLLEDDKCGLREITHETLMKWFKEIKEEK